MSPDGVSGAPGVFGNGLASFSVRGWCGVEECRDSAEGGEGRWSAVSLGSHILAGDTNIVNGTGGSTCGREGSFGGGVESIISRVAGIWHGKRPLGEGVGESIFLVWTPGTRGEPMFTSGHFFSGDTD